jgi:hypothetical protein
LRAWRLKVGGLTPVQAALLSVFSVGLGSVPQPNFFKSNNLAPTGYGWQLVQMRRPRNG